MDMFSRPLEAQDAAPSSAVSDPQLVMAPSTPVGQVMEIGGSESKVILELSALSALANADDATLAAAGQIGSLIKMKLGRTWVLASIRTIRMDRDGLAVASVDYMGEGDEERLSGRLFNFRRGITRYPSPGVEVHPTTTEDMRQIFAADARPHIEVGTVYPTTAIRGALYIDAMLGKHFALLGSTGTGKSTSAALILHRICEVAPDGHIVMIDPHGEYSAAFKSNGALFDASNLQLPYWLMNFAEHCEVFVTVAGTEGQCDRDILAKCLLAARSRNRLAESIGKITVDSPIPYLLSDLSAALQAEMGKLDKATDTAPFSRLKNKIDEVKGDPRFAFMFSGMLVADTMANFIGRVFRLPSEGKPISIIDVSGIPSEITSVVVALLSRLVFDFAIWSKGEQRRPILLVCEEAHRYIPNEREAAGSVVGDILGRIAKEGRKYGVSLGLITQRPSDLAEGVLSQCGTILSMRLNNERDQNFVRAAMPEGARGFLDAIPALRNREMIMCGEGVSIPIRVSLDNLEEHKRPASEDPLFSELWNKTGGEEEAIARTIQRWRSQGR